MRIVITGGAGFIGQAAERAAVEAGHHVLHLDRPPYNIVWPNDVEEGIPAGTGAVIHLAGVLGTSELFDDPHNAIDVNVHGALNILERCADIGAGYVGITMPPVFPSVYTATKICADRFASAWHRARGLPVSRVCAFNAYGPGQKHGPNHPQKIVPTFATEAWAGRPIPVWGDGSQTVDLVHADDIGRMLVAALRYGDDEVFDAGTGRAVTVREVAEFTLSITGSSAGIRYLPMRVGEEPTKIVAEGAGWDLLGWQPVFSWNRLAETIESYKPVAS